MNKGQAVFRFLLLWSSLSLLELESLSAGMPWYTPLAVLVSGCPLCKRLGSYFWRRPQRREELWKRGRVRRVQPRQPSSQPWCTRSFSSNAELMLSIVHCCTSDVPVIELSHLCHLCQIVPDCATKEHRDPGLFSMDWHAADQLLEILFSPGQSDHPGRGLQSLRQPQSRRRLPTKKHKETVIDRDIIIFKIITKASCQAWRSCSLWTKWE